MESNKEGAAILTKPRKVKVYKTAPKHKCWESDGVIQKVEQIGKGVNWFHWIENGIERGCIIVGFNLATSAKKITEEEYNTYINSQLK